MSLRRQAVDLYVTTPGATVRGIAQDLGVSRGTLREWLHRWDTGRKTGPDGAPAPSPLKPNSKTGATAPAQSSADGALASAGESVEERVARPSGGERRLAGGQGRRLTREKEILQQAAKHVSPGRRSGRDRLPGFVADHAATYGARAAL